jgi:hypothetical protein
MNFTVKEIKLEQTKDFILNKHYAQRMPSVSFAFGLFDDYSLQGVITIGKPASNALTEGVCGKEYKYKVYELNRLILNDNLPKNTASYFIGKVFKKIKHLKLILVSYADTAMKHHGYVYQSTNWLYTGMTKPRTDKYTKDGKHSRHYDKNIIEIKRKYRSSKHRYIYFLDKKDIKNLKYEVLPYPKGDNEKYILGYKLHDIIIEKEIIC